MDQIAVELVERARGKEMGALELMTAVPQAEQLGADVVLALYNVWLEHHQEDPLIPVILFNQGIALAQANQHLEACKAYIDAINRNKQLFAAYVNLASAYEKLNRNDLAVQIHEELQRQLALVSLETIKLKAMSLVQLGRIQIAQGAADAAEKNLLESLAIQRQQPDILMHVFDQRLKQCKWPVLEMQTDIPRSEFLRNMAPLTAAAYSNDPLLQLAVSSAYSAKNIKKTARQIRAQHERPAAGHSKKRLRIGYLSSDLYSHAIGSLMSDIFGLHDRDKVAITAYYYGPDRNDHFQKRIRDGVDHWVDINAMDDCQAAQRIADDEIDILVDVNGHSMNARTSILALEPAPIMVNWLGFPGTMGSPYHHYIIADNFIVPPGYERFYSEKVMRLPCYQPNDRQRIVASQSLSRQDCGLPDEAVVFCCFNGSQKITETIFKLWMEILRGVRGSVLWLLSDQEPVNERLRTVASDQGVDPARLVFAERKPNHEHLQRYQLADLFLDTFPYGAHTTASDALWMGVPVVTLAGHGFAARVCGSLVSAAGIPELVATTAEEYVLTALEAGTDKARIAGLKAKLAEQKSSCVLFDMPLLVRSLDALYQQMWDEYLAGQRHQPDLSNLDEYLEVAMDLDHELNLLTPLGDRLAAYRACFEQRARKRDTRLA